MRRYAPLVSLALVAAIVSLALAFAPAMHVGPRATEAIVFGGAALTSLNAVHVASAGWLGSRGTLALGALAAVVLLAFAAFPPTHVALGVVIDVAIVALAHAVGASIGRRVEDAGHVLPATVVAACADVVSVLGGPTHMLLESERALGVVAFAFPVPGVSAFAPALGVGDLVFVALVLGVAHAHGAPHARVAVAALIGALLSGVASASLLVPVPALPAIGAAVLVSSPACRRLRATDRTVAFGARVIAVAVTAFVVARHWLGGA